MSDVFNFPEEKFILIGKVAKVHGLKGEIKVFPYSGQPENIKAYKEFTLVSPDGTLSEPMRVTSCRVQKNLAVIRLEDVSTRNQSEQLIGSGVLLNKNNLPETEKDEYYWRDFINQDVYLSSGDKIGYVDNMFSNGAQDILVIKSGKTEHLIPITKDILLAQRTEGIVINPPPGLLEINSGVDD